MHATGKRGKFQASFCERWISEVRWYWKILQAVFPEAITGVIFFFFVLWVVPVFFMIFE